MVFNFMQSYYFFRKKAAKGSENLHFLCRKCLKSVILCGKSVIYRIFNIKKR